MSELDQSPAGDAAEASAAAEDVHAPALAEEVPEADAAEREPAADAEKSADAVAEAKPLTLDDVTYEVPEGFQVDEGMATEFKTTLIDPELGLSAAQVQALASKLAALHAKSVAHGHEMLRQQVEATRMSNIAALKADPDFGGANFGRNVDTARGVIERFGPTDPNLVDEKTGKPVPGGPVKELLRAHGLDTHPLLTNLFLRIGQATGEDTAHGGAGGEGEDGPMSGEAYYKSVFSKKS